MRTLISCASECSGTLQPVSQGNRFKPCLLEYILRAYRVFRAVEVMARSVTFRGILLRMRKYGIGRHHNQAPVGNAV